VRSFISYPFKLRVILPIAILSITAVTAAAQSSALTEVNSASIPDPVQKRIERARALAAAHQLQLAANELENVRASVKDATLKNVTTLMLMGIYLEEGTYVRAQALLEETFQARASQKDESLHTYFAMAGQTINGVRSHLARYRTWGINTADVALPIEVVNDLQRIRVLLERMIAQAKDIAKEEARANDALALQEDVLGIRLSLARNSEDHDKWQTEYVAAREKLASAAGPVTSLSRTSGLGTVTAKIPNPFSSTRPSESDTTTEQNAPATPADLAAQTPGVTTTPADDTGRVSGAPQADAAEPKLVSTGSLSGRETQRVTPTYPQAAKSAGVGGNVRVFGIVDENGKLWVTNSEGPALLRRAAEDAARRWIFPPTMISGKVVRLAGYIDFEFKP
jgi:TonB family protein